jgi:hypothetical protein
MKRSDFRVAGITESDGRCLAPPVLSLWSVHKKLPVRPSGGQTKDEGMAHFQTGDSICYRKGGPTYWVRSVLEDGRVLVSKNNGRTKLLTRPEEFVHTAQSDQRYGGSSIAQTDRGNGPPSGRSTKGDNGSAML